MDNITFTFDSNHGAITIATCMVRTFCTTSFTSDEETSKNVSYLKRKLLSINYRVLSDNVLRDCAAGGILR